MPILENERQSVPRSALRYRPIYVDQAAPAPVTSRRSRPDALSTTANVEPDELDEEQLLPRPRRMSPIPRQKVAATGRRFHPLFWLGIGAIVLLLLWWGITQALTWGTNELNTLRYGYPRTFQIDAVVGQNDSVRKPSHFIALNLHGNAIVFDLPGGDPSKAREFEITGAVGPSSDLDPVTLRFVDVNHNGKPDMIIDMGGIENILVNDQGTFRPPTPAEQQQILNALRQSGQ